MKLEVLRISSQEDSTSGLLFKILPNGKREFLCYTLEDEYREIKLMHETRIPAGTYTMSLRTVGGFHNRYKKRFRDIHKGMLHINDVPGFEYILIHCGNTDENTSGCLLVGESQESNYRKKNGFVGRSVLAYTNIYPEIAQAIEDGEDVTITYVDYA